MRSEQDWIDFFYEKCKKAKKNHNGKSVSEMWELPQNPDDTYYIALSKTQRCLGALYQIGESIERPCRQLEWRE